MDTVIYSEYEIVVLTEFCRKNAGKDLGHICGEDYVHNHEKSRNSVTTP